MQHRINLLVFRRNCKIWVRSSRTSTTQNGEPFLSLVLPSVADLFMLENSAMKLCGTSIEQFTKLLYSETVADFQKKYL